MCLFSLTACKRIGSEEQQFHLQFAPQQRGILPGAPTQISIRTIGKAIKKIVGQRLRNISPAFGWKVLQEQFVHLFEKNVRLCLLQLDLFQINHASNPLSIFGNGSLAKAAVESIRSGEVRAAIFLIRKIPFKSGCGSVPAPTDPASGSSLISRARRVVSLSLHVRKTIR